MADHRHQRHVLVAVGIEVTKPQVDAVVFAKPLRRIGFSGAPDDRLLDPARQHPIFVDFEVVAQHPGYSERAGNWFGVDGQRRRTQRNGMAPVLVRLHDLAHVRVDPGCDVSHEKPLAEFVEFAQRLTLQVARGPHDESLELHTAQSVPDRGFQHPKDLADPCLPTPNPIAGVRRRGEPRDQRAIQVEERADLGSRRARGDLRDPTRRLRGHQPRLRF